MNNLKMIIGKFALTSTLFAFTVPANAALVSDAILLIEDNSWVAVDIYIDGAFSSKVPLYGGLDGGIALGSTQVHGAIDTDSFLYDALYHTHTGSLFIASDDLNGNATINMTGWTANWNGRDFDMDTGEDAIVTCGIDCSVGDSYILNYMAIVSEGGFEGLPYMIHLEGTIGSSMASVPVPAAMWLFGSGLIGLVGVVRRKKTLYS
jgi:hypothetical protein